MMSLRTTSLLLLTWLALGAPLGANTVLFSNFPANNGPFLGMPGSWVHAQGFTPSTDALLAQISVKIAMEPAGTAVIDLRDDNAGSPGNVIESFTAPAFQMNGSIVTLDSVLHPLLLTSTLYWVTFTDNASDPNTRIYWAWNDALQLGNYRYSLDGGETWRSDTGFQNVQTALEVTGTPEPGTLVLLGLPLIGLGLLRFRHA
ncbi:MAG: hypothetical protein LAP87_02980 [Acidobacteriia bacterium]|nr:hypothetical protein [Terriglobia bacterium]